MPVADLDLLIDTARVAGRIATSFAGPTAQRWDKAGGAGPVTEADLAVNHYLEQTLRRARPDYGWLSEETEDDSDRLGADRVFIIDPIDGTRSFIEGARTWAVSIAVAERGRVTAGVVYLPLRDKLFAAALGQGATQNGRGLRVCSTDLAAARILAAKPNLAEKHWPLGVPSFDRHYRPSLAYRLALVGAGHFHGMLTLRPTWEWDIAAGSLIVAEAGGQITDRGGDTLRFNSPSAQLNGIVAASGALHCDLIGRLNANLS